MSRASMPPPIVAWRFSAIKVSKEPEYQFYVVGRAAKIVIVYDRIELYGPTAMSSFQSLIAQATAVMRALALLVVLWLVSPAQAANIYVTSRFWGRTIIHIDGWIVPGDEKKFAQIASRYPAGSLSAAYALGILRWTGAISALDQAR
jgi:hypothetical protein